MSAGASRLDSSAVGARRKLTLKAGSEADATEAEACHVPADRPALHRASSKIGGPFGVAALDIERRPLRVIVRDHRDGGVIPLCGPPHAVNTSVMPNDGGISCDAPAIAAPLAPDLRPLHPCFRPRNPLRPLR